MPPRFQGTFKKQGSQDEAEVKPKGNEFWRCIKLFQNKWLVCINVFLSMVAGVMPLVMNLMMSGVADLTNEGDFMDNLKSLIKRLVGAICGMWASNQFNQLSKSFLNPSYVVDLRTAVFNAILKQDIAYFDKTTTGVLISRLSEDITLVRETYTDKVLQLLQSITQSLGGIIFALVTCWQPALIAIACMPFIVLVFYFGGKWVDHLWLEYNKTAVAAASKAEEVISQFRTVKAFDCESREAELYSSELDGVDNVYKKTSVAHGVKDFAIHLLQWGMIAGCIYYISWIIVNKPDQGVTPSAIIVMQMSLLFATMGLTTLFSYSDDFAKAQMSAAKLLAIIDSEPTIPDAGRELDGLEGNVEFKNVTFSYTTESKPAVKNLSFKINKGETVALVGESGCGKTTTLQLLQRFYDVNEGEILVDGINIKELAPHFLRSQISTVPQSPVLYTMSVADNIRFSKPNATPEEIQNAAVVGNADKFITELNNGYNTTVQQTSLSGGQKQRICISRAILANSPILLLDEATAALDTESEQLVQKSLETFRSGKTAIVVAHRLATVKNADRILVFKDGSVAETGTHEELLAKGGIYADLVKFQLQ